MYFFLFENRDFSSGLADHRPHVSGENGHWKSIFSKTLSRVAIWKTPISCLCVNGRKRRFSNKMMSYCMMTHAPWGILSCFHCFSFYVWTGENNSNTLRVGAYFLKKEEKISLFKNIRIRMDSPSTYLWLDSWVQTIIVLAVIGVKSVDVLRILFLQCGCCLKAFELHNFNKNSLTSWLEFSGTFFQQI